MEKIQEKKNEEEKEEIKVWVQELREKKQQHKSPISTVHHNGNENHKSNITGFLTNSTITATAKKMEPIVIYEENIITDPKLHASKIDTKNKHLLKCGTKENRRRLK
eukprot:Awhi_evm1s2962